VRDHQENDDQKHAQAGRHLLTRHSFFRDIGKYQPENQRDQDDKTQEMSSCLATQTIGNHNSDDWRLRPNGPRKLSPAQGLPSKTLTRRTLKLKGRRNLGMWFSNHLANGGGATSDLSLADPPFVPLFREVLPVDVITVQPVAE
jgi:hypothetical protein